jgi:hypothetical protein
LVDSHISDLIFLIHRLADLVSKNKAAIKAYYLEYITVADSGRVIPEVEKFLSANRGVAQPVINMLSVITGGIQSLKADSNFEAIRLIWYRVSAALNNTMSGVSMPAAAGLHAAMGHLVTHTRNVDCLSSQLRAHASFQELFWYRQPLLFDVSSQCHHWIANQQQAAASLHFCCSLPIVIVIKRMLKRHTWSSRPLYVICEDSQQFITQCTPNLSRRANSYW